MPATVIGVSEPEFCNWQGAQRGDQADQQDPEDVEERDQAARRDQQVVDAAFPLRHEAQRNASGGEHPFRVSQRRSCSPVSAREPAAPSSPIASCEMSLIASNSVHFAHDAMG